MTAELWNKWAAERKAYRDVDYHVKLIRRAIADAEADGFVVDFDWKGWGQADLITLKMVHESLSWKKSKQVYPMEEK